jgi:DNA-binding transcriptional LysR family regulator
MMSLKKLKYFVAAAETGQISQAAVELNVSQSAVTAAVQQLESALGIRLFDRTPSGVVLTADGHRFLLLSRNVISAMDEAMRLQRSGGRGVSGVVRVGVTYTVAGYFLPRHHARFASSYPDVTLELSEGPRERIEQGLADGSLDIAVMLVSNLRAHEALRSETLVQSRRRLWVPAEHPLLREERVGLAEVAGHPYIMLTVDEADATSLRYWNQAGHQPKVLFRTSSVEAVRSMVAAGMGVTILSDMVYRPWSLEGQRIETRVLAEAVPSMDVGLAWRRDTAPGPATRAFKDFMSLALAGGATP